MNLSSGADLSTYGSNRLIGAVLGFTPQEMMECLEH
jgi:hypothetical protein